MRLYFMACFYPMQALKLSSKTKKGKSVIKFISNETYKDLQSQMGMQEKLLTGLPCGQCVGCRLERSRQWAIRMMHEAQLHVDNCFITLTFDDKHLYQRENPKSLDKSDFQKFMKRFRKKFPDINIRYYMCGEYGELYKRPHYHAIIFGYDFSDKKLEKIVDGNRYYTSDTLRTLWPYGFNIITSVSFDTCAYVARYIMKKHLGKNAWKHYAEYFDDVSGEFVGHRIPEYTTMSRRSGIGKQWLDKYLQDVYPKDKVFMRGKGYSKPPKYYDSLYEIINPEDYSRIKQDRISAALSQAHESSTERLIAKQAVKLAQTSTLKRNLE